jgi:hypothetical protein
MGVHPAALTDEALLSGCDVTTGRAGGPGGQHRNKVETAVRITHRDTGLVGQASERRSQAENKRVAVRRLRWRLAVAVRTPLPAGDGDGDGASDDDRQTPGVPTPSPRWRDRVTAAGAIRLNAEHRDAPAMLAEAMDWLADSGGDVGRAARRLGVTTSQLVKLLAIEPEALESVNRRRAARGERPLRRR